MNATKFCKNDDQLILVVSFLLDTTPGWVKVGREEEEGPTVSFLKITEPEIFSGTTMNPQETIYMSVWCSNLRKLYHITQLSFAAAPFVTHALHVEHYTHCISFVP